MRRLASVVLLLALAGCDRAPTVTAPDGIIQLRVRNLRYDHQNVRVRRGAVTFGVTNEGPGPTDFRVRRRKRALAAIATLQPGDYGTVTVYLRPGTYTMYSSTGRNETLGEYGTLTVTRRRR